MATTVNLLLFMFYLQLRLFKSSHSIGLPQLPAFSEMILSSPWAPLQYVFITLFCAFFRQVLVQKLINESVWDIKPSPYTSSQFISIDTIFVSVVATCQLYTVLLFFDSIHYIQRCAIKCLTKTFFIKIDYLISGIRLLLFIFLVVVNLKEYYYEPFCVLITTTVLQ